MHTLNPRLVYINDFSLRASSSKSRGCRTASRSLCLRGSWRAPAPPPRSTFRSLLSSLRCARGQIEREVLAPGWMEGRSGTVVVLATGIDPSPLVLPPLYPPLLAYPLLLYPRFTPFFPPPSHFSPLLCPPHSLMHSKRTHTTQIIHTHIYEYRSFLSLVLVANPSTSCFVLSLLLGQSQFSYIFHSLILNIQIQRISRVHRV